MNVVEDILVYNICPYLSQRDICSLFNSIKSYRSLYKYNSFLFPYKPLQDCIRDDAIVSYKNLINNGEIVSYKVGLKLACKYNNIPFVKNFLSIRDKILKYIEDNIWKGLDKEEILTSRYMEKDYDDIDEVFKYAAGVQDKEILDYFLNNTLDKCYGFYGACQHSNMYLIANLFENIDMNIKNYKNIDIIPYWTSLYDIDQISLRGGLSYCAQSNNTDLFNHLCKIITDKRLEDSVDWDGILSNSCINGYESPISQECLKIKNISGESAIYYGCKYLNNDLIEKMETLGIEDYTYALYGCAYTGNIELFNKYKDRKKKDYCFIDCMVQAIYGNQLGMVKYLISLGVSNIDYSIELSVKLGHTEIYEYLMTLTDHITYNAQVDLLALNGIQVFHKYKDIYIKIDKDVFIKTILMRACRKGRYERVRYLIDNYDIQRLDIIDALEEANSFGNYDIVMYLFNII